MATFDADTLLKLVSGRAARAFGAASGAAFHSGSVRPGDAFFALRGERAHGLDHADEALARGAAFIVSDRAHPRGIRVEDAGEALLKLGGFARSQLATPVVAVTGSAGKTTTRALLEAALRARATSGNLNTPLPLATSLIDAWLDPDPVRPLVLEVGIDRRGEMAQLAALVRPTHALITVVAASHLDAIGTVADVAIEKSGLLRVAERRYASRQAHRQLPADLRDDTISYALSPYRADVVGEVIRTTHGAQQLSLLGVTVWLPALGRGVAENAVGTAAVARDLGVQPEQLARRLETVRFEGGRLQLRQHRGATLIDDSYNSNPVSAAIALEVLRSLPGPRVAVLGDMLELGPDSDRLHRELGEATRGLDRVVAVGASAHAVATGNPEAETAADLAAATELLAPLPRAGTLLFKASRGMRFERLIAALTGGVDEGVAA